jgi:hypothetical protein
MQKVAKAYETLTDPTARENWEKYGNPDGRQALEVRLHPSPVELVALRPRWQANSALLIYSGCHRPATDLAALRRVPVLLFDSLRAHLGALPFASLSK